ncbi:MAG: DUF1178 family protein [Betaproteobacteria bacterium]
MIVFDLCCAHGHAFEGWFDSADAYAAQRARELVRCPVCDDAAIDKRLSARVNTGKAMMPAAQSTKPAVADTVAGLPPQLLAKLREIVRNTENVGDRFAEEARKIHYDEVPPRAIRGQATPDEAESLREEGIDFASLPASVAAETH